MFLGFTYSFPELRTFKGYRLIGADGSAIVIPLNKKEPETLHQNKEAQKCFRQCYFNGAYDLLNAIYVDTVLSTQQKTDGRSALLTTANRSTLPEKSVLAADRGYVGWRMLVELDRTGRKFVNREKDNDSQGIFRSPNLSEDEEFDPVKPIILTNKQTKETLSSPILYRIVMSNQSFPYLYFDYDRASNGFTEAENGIISRRNAQGNGYSFQILRGLAMYGKSSTAFHPNRQLESKKVLPSTL